MTADATTNVHDGERVERATETADWDADAAGKNGYDHDMLREIAYDHAEGVPSGELKHGPLALVTPETPVSALLAGRSPRRR